MTIYTDGLIVRPGRNVLDDAVTGQLDAAKAAWQNEMFLGSAGTARRIAELRTAQDGEILLSADPRFCTEEIRAEPATPML